VYSLVVCDTEPVVIEGICSLLEESQDMRLAATENSLADGLEAVRDLSPSVYLVDKAFGIHAVMDGIKAMQTYRQRTATVVWGASLSEAEALRFLQKGATGVIRKTARLDKLRQCLLAAANGETWVEEDVLSDRKVPARLSRTALTAREMQVMELVEQGMKNKDIASVLGIRTGTVKIHLKHIFEKTGIRGRYGLALSGLKAKGLLALPEIRA
jgi:DNA-binding NarL/FixJ family response regulator